MNKYIQLYLMCGLPGSGKSTLAKKYQKANKDLVIVSRDEIRFSLLDENEPYFAKEKETFEIFVKTINKNLLKGKMVIADATHLTKTSRAKLLNQISPKYKAEKGIGVIYMDIPLETCLKQNQKRFGTKAYVPEQNIKDMEANFQAPALYEGFSTIIVQKEGGKK